MTEADKIINQHAALSAGAAALPFPVVDMVALSSNQLVMLRRLGKLYEDKDVSGAGIGSKVISTLIATVAPASVAHGAIGSVVKAVPVIGPVIGFLTFPVFASASTIALGNVFQRHYENGGSIINFNPAHYTSQFVQAFRKETAAATAEAEPQLEPQA